MLSESPERVMMLWLPELDEGWLATALSSQANAKGPEDTIEDRGRRWAHTLRAIEHLIPGNEPVRNGWCAMRARGPARYYGGEAEAALALINRMRELGFTEARVGIANGRFAAEQAARETNRETGQAVSTTMGDIGVRIVAPEDTARLLNPLPIARAASDELAEVLMGLGIRTLGAFAALPAPAVHERFGAVGAAAHRRARGLGPAYAAEVQPRPPLIDLTVHFALEPPLEGSDQLAFACTPHAEELLQRLMSTGLVCTELRVELTDDIGVRHERQWAHPGRFHAVDVVNRVRWQAGSMPRDRDRGGSGIAAVRLTSVRTARAAEHEPGLWSTAPDERVHHHLSRVQSLLGHRGVGTGELMGGRLSADRQRLVPWGTRLKGEASSIDDARGTGHSNTGANAGSNAAGNTGHSIRARAGPWPGHLPGLSPNIVFTDPPEAALFDGSGTAISLVSDMTPALSVDLVLSADPVRLNVGGNLLAANIRAWSSLWPVRERWWAGSATRYRLQLLLADGDAWLLHYESGRGWLAEARYD